MFWLVASITLDRQEVCTIPVLSTLFLFVSVRKINPSATLSSSHYETITSMRTKTGISLFKGKWRSLSSLRTLTRWPKTPRTLATRSLLKLGPQSTLVKIEDIFVNLKMTPFLCCRSFLWLSEWTQRQGDLIIISQMTVKISPNFQLSVLRNL